MSGIFSRCVCILLSVALAACATHKPIANWRPASEHGGATALRTEQAVRVHTQDGAAVDLVFERFDNDAMLGRTKDQGAPVRMPIANIAWVERQALDASKSIAVASVLVLALMVFGLSQGALFTVP
jgi:hypothetical protein